MERISRTGKNVYDKLDKERFMLFPNTPQKPTVFVDAENLTRERNSRPTNWTDEETQKSYEEFMARMDKLEEESKNETAKGLVKTFNNK